MPRILRVEWMGQWRGIGIAGLGNGGDVNYERTQPRSRMAIEMRLPM